MSELMQELLHPWGLNMVKRQSVNLICVFAKVGSGKVGITLFCIKRTCELYST